VEIISKTREDIIIFSVCVYIKLILLYSDSATTSVIYAIAHMRLYVMNGAISRCSIAIAVFLKATVHLVCYHSM